MQLTTAALWCTNLYSGAWSAHASVLTVLASLAIWVQGPHKPKASMWGVRSKVGLRMFKNKKTSVWDTDTNVLGLGWGGVTVCRSPAGVFWGLAILEGRCPLHLHCWLKSAQLESKGMAVLLGWGWCSGYWAKPQRSSCDSGSATAPAQPYPVLQSWNGLSPWTLLQSQEARSEAVTCHYIWGKALMTRRYISIHFWRDPPLEVSGIAQWPTGEGRTVTCLGSGKGAMSCEWYRWPRFGTERQCWGCEQREPAAQGSQAAEGHMVLHWRSPRAQASACSGRKGSNPMAGQCQHTPTTCGRSKAGC